MTQLANANLLDESVANSSSLKNRRINKTAKTAVNPNPRVDKIEKTEVKEKEVEEDEYGSDTDYEGIDEIRNDNYKRFESNNSSKRGMDTGKNNKASNDEKILGMSKPIFYTVLGVAVIIGGIWAYNKFIKKGKTKITDSVKGGLDNATNIASQPPINGMPN